MSRVAVLFLCVLAAGPAPWAKAGELTPPPGPVAATGATQLNSQWVTLPHTITEPGLYVLTSDLESSGGTHGIVIQSSNVTLDLNGFSLIGGDGDGVRPGSGTHINIEIRNGNILNWSGNGVNAAFMDFDPPFENGSFSQGRIDRLKVRQCGGTGIQAPFHSIVRDCVVEACGGTGIRISNSGAVLENCAALINSGAGISAGEGVLITGCTSSLNQGPGLELINDKQIVLNGIFSHNDGGGIANIRAARVEGCTVSSNTPFGLTVTFEAQITKNLIVGNNGDGILGVNVAPSGENVITDNTVLRNTGIGLHFPNNAGNHLYRNVLKLNGGSPIHAPGSDAPLQPTSATAGPWDNVGS